VRSRTKKVERLLYAKKVKKKKTYVTRADGARVRGEYHA